MNRFLLAVLFVSTSVCAAPGGNGGKPPPVPPAQGPLMMVDSLGTELGPAIPRDNEALAELVVGTYVRYGGETFSVRFDVTGENRYFAPRSSPVYFSAVECTGTAYIDLGSIASALMYSPRAAVVAYATAEDVPGGRYLYATAAHNTRDGMVFGYGSKLLDGDCLSGGSTPGITPATFVVDLTIAFPPPYKVK